MLNEEAERRQRREDKEVRLRFCCEMLVLKDSLPNEPTSDHNEQFDMLTRFIQSWESFLFFLPLSHSALSRPGGAAVV